MLAHFDCCFTGDKQEETITLGSSCIQPTNEIKSMFNKGMSQIKMHYMI